MTGLKVGPTAAWFVGRFLYLGVTLVLAGPGLAATTQDATKKHPWNGALDLRKALTQDRGQFVVDDEQLRAAGIDPAEFLPPKRLKSAAPLYPDTSKRAGAEGRVQLDCLVQESGSVDFCKVTRSVHGDLDRAAVGAVVQWKYEPAKLNGVTRAVIAQFIINFRLR